MDIALYPQRMSTTKCRDLIIILLSQEGSVSAKKLYALMREQFRANYSYQAVHKALKKMLRKGIVTCEQNEYSIDAAWKQYIMSFLSHITSEEGTLHHPQEDGPPDYAKVRLASKALRFIPFFMPQGAEQYFTEGRNTSFYRRLYDQEGHELRLYPTGVCVYCLEESLEPMNCVEYLLYRRRRHQEILEGDGIPTPLCERQEQVQLDYVMSVHTVLNTGEIEQSHFNQLIKLMTQPSILQITDIDSQSVTEHTVTLAYRKLRSLQTEELANCDIQDASVDASRPVYASWANIVGSCRHEDELESLEQQMRDIEFDLQHLWFYFDQMRKRINSELQQGHVEALTYYTQKRLEFGQQFHDLLSNESIIDSQFLLLKDAMVDTSRIKNVYEDLESAIHLAQVKRGEK